MSGKEIKFEGHTHTCARAHVNKHRHANYATVVANYSKRDAINRENSGFRIALGDFVSEKAIKLCEESHHAINNNHA